MGSFQDPEIMHGDLEPAGHEVCSVRNKVLSDFEF